ncbi:MAG: mandelate racemase/muconate lactonizing enzyme family protein [Betaproteobacteria bacterium]|nr:mandelate racemase/muconate lactonizing enzyme family protein [Betaproteobacteria bacterium]
MRVVRVETIPLRLPLKIPLVESGGTFSKFDHVLVKLRADNGLVGLGEVEAYPSFERPGVETQEGIVAIIRDHLGPAVMGQSPFDLIAIWKRMDKAVDSYLRVKAALDIACYDLMGRELGIPVSDLLGGRVRESYVVEGVGYGISIGEPAEVAAAAKAAVARGYRQLELKAGDERPERDLERLHLVRKAIGRDVPIKIDFNGFYDTKTAIRLIREMERLGVQWIEQPVKAWDLEGLAMIRNAAATTIVVDESIESPQDMMRVVRHGAADAVHIKPTIKGGFTTAKKIAAIAEAAGVAIVPGTSAPSGVGMAAAQAFIASCPVLSGGAHGSPLDILVEDIVTEPIPADSTMVRVRTEPGLGIELNERAVAKYRAPQ